MLAFHQNICKGGWKAFGSSCLHPWCFPRSLPCKPHPEDAGNYPKKGSQEEAFRHPSFLKIYHPGIFQLGLGSCFSLIRYLASHQVNMASSSQTFYRLSNQVVTDWFPENQIPHVGLWGADRDSITGLDISMVHFHIPTKDLDSPTYAMIKACHPYV